MLTDEGRERWARAHAETATKAELHTTTPDPPRDVNEELIDAGRERVALLQAEMIVGQFEFIERAASVRARMEEDTLRAEVIKVLRAQGYTVIPPGEGA
jgi:hypothetical protein